MSGLLTTLFEDGEDGTSAQTQSTDVNGDAGLDISPSIGLSHHAEGSYEGLDGSTHDWSSDTDVQLDTSVAVDLVTFASTDQSSLDQA